jgi:hypothetical protein
VITSGKGEGGGVVVERDRGRCRRISEKRRNVVQMDLITAAVKGVLG